MAWIYKKGNILEESGCSNVNFLFNEDKFYIMDNHLCAIWCWEQKITPGLRYGLFHIDRHYDLLNNLTSKFLEENRESISGHKFEDFLSVVAYNKIRYDNYIDSFCRLHPNLIQKVYYATHQDGTDEKRTSLEAISKYEPSLWDLPTNIDYWINSENNQQIDRWILNIDIDFFFQKITDEDTDNQFLTNKYISGLCEGIKKSLPYIDVITIALSPEFCNGWGNAFHVLKHINENLNIPMHFKYKRIKKQSYLL